MFSGLKSWFSNLSGPQKLGTAIVAIATGVTAVVGAVNGSITLYEKLFPPAAHLEYVDVGYNNALRTYTLSPEDYVPQLDIKLINTSGHTAYVKQANLEVKKVWTLTPPYTDAPNVAHAYTKTTFNYEVVLPVKDTPYTISQDLSQTIKPDETDRFTISMNSSADARSGKDYVLLVDVSLLYNEGDETSSQPVLFLASNQVVYYYIPNKNSVVRKGLEESDVARIMAKNKRSIEEIKQIEAPKDERLQQLIQTISQA